MRRIINLSSHFSFLKDNPRLYMHLIDLMMDEAVANRTDIVAVFDKALGSSMPNDVKMLFAHRKMEFLEDFGDDAAELVNMLNLEFDLNPLLASFSSIGLRSPDFVVL